MIRFNPRALARRRSLLRIGVPIACCLTVLALSVSMASTAPAGPVGLTAIAGNASVGLAWQPVSGATGYNVYRSATVDGARTLLTTQPTATTGYSDATAANGQAAYYVVTAVAASGESPASNIAGATPRARTCSSGNAIVLENCMPGTTAWKTQNRAAGEQRRHRGLCDRDERECRRQRRHQGPTRRPTTCRSTWRSTAPATTAGANGRLVSTLPGLTGQRAGPAASTTRRPACATARRGARRRRSRPRRDWPSGVYLLRLVRDDNGDDNHILLVVRHDGDHAAVLYGVPTATYQAYNNYGGKSLYDFNSTGDATVSGTTRAVAVSYDRPFQQSVNGVADWYPNVDVRNVSWLEQQGYDMTTSRAPTSRRPGALSGHRVFVSPSHDEYWSAGMRSAVTAARDAGTSLAFLGSNAIYWKIRYSRAPSPAPPTACRRVTRPSQAGPPIRAASRPRRGATRTARTSPRTALLGQMYIGDNDGVTFRYRVSDVQGHDTLWRRTSVANLAAGGQHDARPLDRRLGVGRARRQRRGAVGRDDAQRHARQRRADPERGRLVHERQRHDHLHALPGVERRARVLGRHATTGAAASASTWPARVSRMRTSSRPRRTCSSTWALLPRPRRRGWWSRIRQHCT